MNLAFCLFNYFPYGGLQRDFLHILRACRARNHEIHVYTMDWKGECEPGVIVTILQSNRLQNHTQTRDFAEKVKPYLAQHDLVVGFNKMPYLDIYYAADVCFKARIEETRPFWYRFTPRYRQYAAMEEAVFAAGKNTDILLIAPKQQTAFIDHYQTEANRFHHLPPVLSTDRKKPQHALERRAEIRAQWGANESTLLLVFVGSRFRVKGLDRVLLALKALPDAIKNKCQLLVIGDDNPTPFQRLSKQLNLTLPIHFLGGRRDVPDLLLASDLLIHPAYLENTGTVLLEAMVMGLPVLTVDHCGYAHYVKEAGAGEVMPGPYDQDAFNQTLEKLLSGDLAPYHIAANTFAERADIYNMPEAATNLIESIAARRHVIPA